MENTTTTKTKRCCRCKQELPVTEFHKDRTKKDGLNGMCKECTKRQNKKYYEERKEEVKFYYRERRKQLKRKATRKKARQRRDEKMAALPNTLTEEQWQETLKEFEYACAYCGRKDRELQKDHLVPVVKGGSFSKYNIVPACPNCNASKADCDFLEWYMLHPFFSTERLDKIVNFVRRYTLEYEEKLENTESREGDGIEELTSTE
jgi:hypothetical protein